MKKILITGACGFIGFHLSLRLCQSGYKVFGIDNFSCTDKKLLKSRLRILKKHKSFKFYKIDLSENFEKEIKDQFYAIHLAAKPGVRESQKKPKIYFKNNITAFYNIIDFARRLPLLYMLLQVQFMEIIKRKKLVVKKIEPKSSHYHFMH